MTRVQTTRLTLFALLCSATCGCAPPFYFGKSIHGRVVDAQTNQPLPGAVVVALWELDKFISGTGPVLTAQETTADSTGAFTIPGWGPKFRPCLTRLLNNDPTLFVFRAGYEPIRVMNADRQNVWSFIRRSDWNDSTFALQPFSGSPHDRFGQLDSLLGYFVFGACLERGFTFPRLHTEVSRERNNPIAGRDLSYLQSRLKILIGTER